MTDNPNRPETTAVAKLLADSIGMIRAALAAVGVDGPVAIVVEPGGRQAIGDRLCWELRDMMRADPACADGKLRIVGVEIRDGR